MGMYDYAQRFSLKQSVASGVATRSEKVLDFSVKKNYEQGTMEKINMHIDKSTTLAVKVYTGDSVSGGRIVTPKMVMALDFAAGDVLGFVLPANRSQFVELEYTTGSGCKISAYLTDSIETAM